MPAKTLAKTLAAALLALALAGCANWNKPSKWFDSDGALAESTGTYMKYIKPYRPDVHQGNLITREMVEELKVGMTTQQVVFLLGQPLLKDEFHKSRWDYVYYVNPRIGKPERRRLTVFFDEAGRVKSYAYTGMPSEEDADKIILGSKSEFHAEGDAMTVVDGSPATR